MPDYRTGCLLLLCAACTHAQPSITTAQYDNHRTGANLEEKILTPRNVNEAQFGKLFMIPVDGDVYAQPLYIPKLEIPGKGVHDVVFAATEHDSVYAIDAAGTPTEPLWQVSFLNERTGVRPVASADVRCSFIAPEIGITPTPVIDAAARTMYVLVRTSERSPDGEERYYQRLHALDITTGAERPGSPVLIRASWVSSSFFGLMRSEVRFHAQLENPRAALLLSKGTVYIAWGSSCDAGPYHGWVLAYDARTLKQTGVFNTSPDSTESGIWQSDAGIAADDEGNVYAVTGNGKFDAASSGGRDYGDSVLKLGFQNGGLGVRDYFTPFNESRLNSRDEDLGSSGPVLLPDQPGSHPHVLVVAGKAGVIYVIDRDRMGKFHAGSDSHAVQTLTGVGTSSFGAPAYWNGHLFYFGSNDVLKDFTVDHGQLAATPVHTGKWQFKDPGAIPVVSANGNQDGIVWLVLTKGWRDRDTSAVLQAYDAADVSRRLFVTGSDGPGYALRFTMPTVANGRVYIGARRAIYAYGLTTPAKPRGGGRAGAAPHRSGALGRETRAPQQPNRPR